MYLSGGVVVSLLSGACLGVTPSKPLLWRRTPCSNLNVLPMNTGMRGNNGIYWGWNPDIEKGDNISAINMMTGRKASTVGIFSQINSPNGFDGHQLLRHLDEVKGSGAALIASVMPNGLSFNEVTPKIAEDIAKVVRQFTDQGVEVWLRFAHEMNYYVRPGTYRGNSTQFIKAWRTIHNATKDIDGCLLFWCPNNAKLIDLMAEWWPGAEHVDIVGMDQYPSSLSATFKSTYGAFYDAYAKKYNKHMAIPETATKPDNATLKQAWVRALASADVRAEFPCLQSVTWFELHKSWDYRVVMGQDKSVRDRTLSNFR
ncbi:glycoside hydrolase superfamily [Podospora didyma]|uniref:Glycoside hydrolase superfamily n=1 Tax=Podospora didyma TaxID=330526 RepID=A0AAE0KA64_9PEZI|nr:glycoside hydrolase superfamily [Podospora didyma]